MDGLHPTSYAFLFMIMNSHSDINLILTFLGYLRPDTQLMVVTISLVAGKEASLNVVCCSLAVVFPARRQPQAMPRPSYVISFILATYVGSYDSKPHDPLVEMHEHINSILKLTHQINASPHDLLLQV
jgi:hypothetical protein